MNNLITNAEIDALHTKTFKERIPLNSEDLEKITHAVALLQKKSIVFILPSGERAILIGLGIIFKKHCTLNRIAKIGLKLVG